MTGTSTVTATSLSIVGTMTVNATAPAQYTGAANKGKDAGGSAWALVGFGVMGLVVL